MAALRASRLVWIGDAAMVCMMVLIIARLLAQGLDTRAGLA